MKPNTSGYCSHTGDGKANAPQSGKDAPKPAPKHENPRSPAKDIANQTSEETMQATCLNYRRPRSRWTTCVMQVRRYMSYIHRRHSYVRRNTTCMTHPGADCSRCHKVRHTHVRYTHTYNDSTAWLTRVHACCLTRQSRMPHEPQHPSANAVSTATHVFNCIATAVVLGTLARQYPMASRRVRIAVPADS